MKPDSQVHDEWEKHWERGFRPTLLGAYIVRVKHRHIRRLLEGRQIGSCIDIGCGRGVFLSTLSQITGNAVGLDVSPAAVAACRARGLHAMQGDLLEHPSTYDLVFSDGLIEHFEDFRPYLAGLCRLSKRYLIIAQTNHASPLLQMLFLLERRLKPGVNVPEYPHRLPAFIDECAAHSFLLVGQTSILLGALKVLLFEKTPPCPMSS
jgi:SAM-dependent methyltransferase